MIETRSTRSTLVQASDYVSCNCRPQRKLQRKQVLWGSMEFYHETAQFERHLPTCAFSQFTREHKRTWGMRHVGMAWFLQKAVQISLSMKSGAGGLSISPVFRYYATVDEENAPAFQVVHIMTEFIITKFRDKPSQLSSIQHQRLLETGLTKIGRLFQERIASPNDVNSMNQTLMHPIANLVHLSVL